MSGSWPLVALGGVATLRKEFIEIDDGETYKRCRVQLHGQGIVLRDVVLGLEIRTKRQQVCRTGELLVAEIDAKHGGLGIVPKNLDGAIVSAHYFLYCLDGDRVDRKFLGFFTRTPAFQDQIAAQGTTNYAAIRAQDVLAYRIPLPPLEEQRRIVARIEGLVKRVEEVRKLQLECAEAEQTLVVSLHKSLAGSKVVELSNFLVLDEDRVEIADGELYPQVGVKGFGQGLFTRDPVARTETTYSWFNRLYDGALVLSQVKGWEGAVAVCGADHAGRYVSPEYRTFRCRQEMALPEYLATVVATPWFWERLKFATRGVGGRRERTRPEQFLKLSLPMPSVEAQRKAIPILEKLRLAAPKRQEVTTKLDALLPSILDRAFRGELC